MVAIDRDMKAINIPQFKPKTDEENDLWNAAQRAREAMS
jgi:acyl-CoA hydrolase